MVSTFIYDGSAALLMGSPVMTGEEEEDTLLQVRGKLFSLDDNTWRERGTGLLKLNVKQDDGSGARLGLFLFLIRGCLH